MKETAQLMYQTALIESGFVLNDPKDFAGRIYNSVKSSLKISPDAVAEEEVEAEETETSEEATEAKSDDLAGGLNIEAEQVEERRQPRMNCRFHLVMFFLIYVFLYSLVKSRILVFFTIWFLMDYVKATQHVFWFEAFNILLKQ